MMAERRQEGTVGTWLMLILGLDFGEKDVFTSKTFFSRTAEIWALFCLYLTLQ